MELSLLLRVQKFQKLPYKPQTKTTEIFGVLLVLFTIFEIFGVLLVLFTILKENVEKLQIFT